MSAKNNKLILTVTPSPRLWLAPAKFTKSLFGAAVKSPEVVRTQTNSETNGVRLFLNVKE